jgi:hypothetical protein
MLLNANNPLAEQRRLNQEIMLMMMMIMMMMNDCAVE